jgi:hypothetical protein
MGRAARGKRAQALIEHAGRRLAAQPPVTELRGRGIDDEGGWDRDETRDIPVAARATPRL